MRKHCAVALGIGLLALWKMPVANAATYPTKPIRIISGVGVGGTFDIFIRALADDLMRKWGQAVVIEPRPSGNNVTATRACAEAAPDGYTLCSLSGENLVYPEFLVKELGVNLRTDLKPIANLFFNPQMLVVSADLKSRDLSSVVQVAKTMPRILAYTAPGPTGRLFMEDLNRRFGLDIVNVPFRGGSDSLSNLLSGSIQFVFTGAANFTGLIEDRKVYPLVVDSETRLSAYPDVPTVRESGFSGAWVRNYLGLAGPRALPGDLVDQINAQVNSTINDPSFRKRHLLDRGLLPANGSVKDFEDFLAVDRLNSEKVVRDAHLPLQ
jgi:tripartite-type tricarboxylate transporter receptor subunit TctC